MTFFPRLEIVFLLIEYIIMKPNGATPFGIVWLVDNKKKKILYTKQQ